ncbi:hypothetical protein N658DRAFT_558881 [Parathielavia hyrcaniae]|uniref:Uncharacterized protein n=1 Tax=Parathielavia hyrcaniae TaxID=113614 RepID=A0AAN6T1J1_9PEZI|nr:hypothetical protein N658DRAFT_558881 [Parathielavia hyrcaniae]
MTQDAIVPPTGGMIWQRIKAAVVYFWNFRYLPLKYRWPLIKLRRRLLPTRTGLGLRNALRHARSLKHPPEPHPYLFVLRLLWPFPTWHFPAVLPPPPRQIMADPGRVSCRVRDLRYLRSMPLWRARDTPQRSFYRLYEAFCAADGHMITYDTEYFWRRSSPGWATANIADPQCRDLGQYAVMASLAEVLVESFAWRLELGMRRTDRSIISRSEDPQPSFVPEVYSPWTAKVPPLQSRLLIHPEEDREFDSPFHRRNASVLGLASFGIPNHVCDADLSIHLGISIGNFPDGLVRGRHVEPIEIQFSDVLKGEGRLAGAAPPHHQPEQGNRVRDVDVLGTAAVAGMRDAADLALERPVQAAGVEMARYSSGAAARLGSSMQSMSYDASRFRHTCTASAPPTDTSRSGATLMSSSLWPISSSKRDSAALVHGRLKALCPPRKKPLLQPTSPGSRLCLTEPVDFES